MEIAVYRIILIFTVLWSSVVVGNQTKPADWTVANTSSVSQERQYSSIPPPVNYGQVFIKEVQDTKNLLYDISLFLGMEIETAYQQSFFVGMDIKRKIMTLSSLGLEVAGYYSRESSQFKTFQDRGIGLYGIRGEIPLLYGTTHLNWYYHLLQGNVNLIGLYKLHMEIIVHAGLGLGLLKKEGIVYTTKFGIGSRLSFNPSWYIQITLSRRIIIPQFLTYTPLYISMSYLF